ncbi:MAG TPA: S-layer homology domain-containing protein [Clostridiaceae bacterium]|nr:S-layer homology domain-containing protein [Clostridiaceae bacterium]
MIKLGKSKLLIALIAVFMLFATQANAAVDPSVIEKSANSLVKLGIMHGDENGNLNLGNDITRCEFVALVVRMMGYEETTDVSNMEMPFKDVLQKHWAYKTIKVAFKRGIINGYEDNTFRPNEKVNFAEAQSILLRVLNYGNTLSGKWPDNVMNKSSELGLSKNLNFQANKKLTRGEASVLIYNSLTIDFN